jgi:diguanylate cyclase (GGDEF)-like protein
MKRDAGTGMAIGFAVPSGVSMCLCVLLMLPTPHARGDGASDTTRQPPESREAVSLSAQAMGLSSGEPELPAGRIDTAVRLAAEDPNAARRALDALAVRWFGVAEPDGASDLQRLLRRGRLQIHVEAREAEALSAALVASPPPERALSPAAADLALMQAQLAELRNLPSESSERAREALLIYRSSCPLAAALRNETAVDGPEGSEPTHRTLQAFPDCDYRAVWQAERILERQAMTGGVLAQARTSAEGRLALALAADDAYRSAQSWSLLAYLAALSGDPPEAVAALLAQAARSAERTGDPGLRIRMLINEAAVARLAGDARVALARTRSALSLARSAGLQQPQVTLLNNLADAQLRLRQPRQALRTVEEALPLAERLGDMRVLHALRNNAGLARIGLGQIEEGKRDMQQAEALLGTEGASGQRVEMLREFGEALAAAGDARGALELYHRERALAAEISRENLEAALREIQASFDAEVRQRDLSLLQDQIATRNDELASQDLTLRIWLLLFALLGVLLLLGALVYSRLRGRERLLSERRERLRRESEQDPLTGLGNRRAFEARMRAIADPPSPAGALLLLDIDRFKQINDRYGHASGDVVLIEVARRIQACLRRDDLVVRWGGEEFLVHVSAMGAEQALILARRILERIAGEAIEVSNGSLRTTASLGLCMDGLPGSGQGLHWEERLRLADLALYAAKSRGRNRAVGVVDCSADVEALRAPEIDFEAAERSGLVRVQSVVIAG